VLAIASTPVTFFLTPAPTLTLSDRGLQLFFEEIEFFGRFATKDLLFGGTV
jgi:hypothetical protein